jgi:hypothetical protein
LGESSVAQIDVTQHIEEVELHRRISAQREFKERQAFMFGLNNLHGYLCKRFIDRIAEVAFFARREATDRKK